MYPLLISWPIPIHTYGFLIAIGFLTSLYVIRRLAEMAGLDSDRVQDLCFWSLVVGFIGARTLFVITRLDYFLADPISIFKVWEGGLVFYGGPIAVIPFIIWYAKKYKLPIWDTLDVSTPPLVIAHVFGRLGCLSAGCCYGKPTGTSFGIRLYSELVDKDLRGIPLHPTQLYEASALFILFWGLIWVFKHRSFHGQVALSYLIAYPIIRSVVEIFRGDLIRGFVIDGILSTSQFISILVFITGSIILITRLKKVKN